MFILRFFRNLKITNKLFLLLLSILVGFVSIGSAYWLVLENQHNSGARTAQFIQFGQHISEAQQSYYKVRRYEKDFLLGISAATGRTYNEAPLAEHEKQMSKLLEQMVLLVQLAPDIDSVTLDKSFTDINGNPVNYMTRLVSQAQTVVTDYQNSFDDIVRFNKVVGLSSEQGLRKQIASISAEMQQKINQYGSAEDAALLAKMGVDLQQILQSTDLTGVYEDLKTEHAHLLKAIKVDRTLDIRAPEISALADRYLDAVSEIVDNKRRANEYTELYDFMLGPIFDEMVLASEQFISSNLQSESARSAEITNQFAYALLGVFLAIAIVLYLFGKGFVNPILSIQSTIQKVNEGDTTARTGMKRNDELGQLASAFDKLLDERVSQLANSEQENEQLNNSIIELLKSVAQLSQKDFTVDVPVFEDVTGAVGDSLNLLSRQTSGALSDVRKISGKVADAIDQIRSHADELIKVAQDERSQVEGTASQLQLTSQSMSDISQGAQQVNGQAADALHNTQTALVTVNQTIQGINGIRDTISETEKRIKRLGERSQEITGIVNLINSIAERTHILALNASMHAASSGEAGRGFAVVADEVQRLAENAREATTEIGTLVNNIRVETADTVSAMNNAISQVAQGTKMAEQAGLAMQNTQRSTEELVHSIEIIAASSKEQARATIELVKRADQIVSGTRQTERYLNTQMVATKQLSSYSEQLVTTVNAFKLRENVDESELVEVPEFQQMIDSDELGSERVAAQ